MNIRAELKQQLQRKSVFIFFYGKKMPSDNFHFLAQQQQQQLLDQKRRYLWHSKFWHKHYLIKQRGKSNRWFPFFLNPIKCSSYECGLNHHWHCLPTKLISKVHQPFSTPSTVSSWCCGSLVNFLIYSLFLTFVHSLSI